MIIYKKGDKVKLLSKYELLAIFERRNFFTSPSVRENISALLHYREGVVEDIEEKYKFDYFFFKPNGSEKTYSIPYESIMGKKAW